ncbi:phytoene desaturase [Bacillus ectoiniformans]|uniref:phytoene desaturase family protein n=1 Tax=Bacillus ectoiniformans TaxID=1494429 RepID=UPI001957936F|nr:phytoene desaturase family protein [Bacillus ectoiniformans]MBM7647569.1 phytoene desaturase [Bacillus ectoiniformans]
MKAAIAGGGIGGMMTALLLRKQGFDVVIYEKDDRLGGRLAFVEKDGFKIDKGPTIVLLPEMFREFLREAGIDDEDYELIQCDPLYDIHFNDGNSYTKYADLQTQIEEIRRRFPGDELGFQRFMKDMDIRFRLGKEKFLEKPFFKKKDFWNTPTLQTLLKLKAYKSVMENLKTYFSHEDLRTAYALQTLYIGGNPFVTPSIYSLVSYSEHKHGIYYLKGGYASLTKVLENALLKQGVTIRKGAPVNELLVDGKTAYGVSVNGQQERADLVVLNGDFPVAEKLLKKSVRKYESSSSCFLLYMGLDKIYQDKNIHQFYLGEDFEENMNQVFSKEVLPEDPSIYVFHPSVVDPSLAPEGKGVLYVLVPVPAGDHIDWEREKDSYKEKIMIRLEEKGFTDLQKHMEWVQIRTPKEAMDEGLYMGGSFGIAPTLFQSGIFRPQVKAGPYTNVYAVGASTHPGGGIPIVMQGAHVLSETIKKEWNLSSFPEKREDHEHSIRLSNL